MLHDVLNILPRVVQLGYLTPRHIEHPLYQMQSTITPASHCLKLRVGSLVLKNQKYIILLVSSIFTLLTFKLPILNNRKIKIVISIVFDLPLKRCNLGPSKLGA